MELDLVDASNSVRNGRILCRICLADNLPEQAFASIWDTETRGDTHNWKTFLMDTMQLRIAGRYNVPSTVCKVCKEDLRNAFNVFLRAARSTAHFLRQQDQQELHIALMSRNGDSAAGLTPSGKKTYFTNDLTESAIALMEQSIANHCDKQNEKNAIVLSIETPAIDFEKNGEMVLNEHIILRTDVEQHIASQLEKTRSISLPKLNAGNLGFQMLQKQGWAGGPIGKNSDGIAEPVDINIKSNRYGLGTEVHHRTSSSSLGYQHIFGFLRHFKLKRTDVAVMLIRNDFAPREHNLFKACCRRLQLQFHMSHDHDGQVLKICKSKI